MKLFGQIVEQRAISPAQRDQMFALMERYYAGMTRAAFDRDLAEKQWVIEVRDHASNRLHGFSTQMVIDVEVGGNSVHALFSGDTIVEADCWGQGELAAAWGRLALALIERYPPGSLYWFLISKGYKTYRYLPLFFREFYPRRNIQLPPQAAAIIDALGQCKFAACYDAQAKIVRAENSSCRLRQGVADVDARRLRDPDVRFFIEKNPGYLRGDELCCLAPLTHENFSLAAARPLRQCAAQSFRIAG